MVGRGQGLRSSASLAILCGFSFLAVSALVVEDDLLMVESQNTGPAIAILPPPPELIAEDDDQLMMESREAKPLALASPERSAVDQHQFVMAANYLKNQFSIPHHLVPSYQDISRRSGLMKRRLDNLPNIENHRFNPEISPYDVPKVEELKKNPEEYKNANIYRMDNQVSSSSQQRNTIHRRKFDVKPPPRTSDSGYRRSRFPPKPPKLTRKFDSPGLLSSLLSPFNPFRSRPEPENMRKFGAIPDKFRYPLPREHQASDRRLDNGQRRRGHGVRVSEEKPFREVLKKKIEKKYEPDPLSNRKPMNVEKREPVKYKERRRLQRKPEASIRKNLENSLLRKRVSPPRSGGRRSDDKELVWRSKEDIDGLDLSFWVDEADQSTTAKPDYRRRWRNLTQEYEEAETTKKTLNTIDRVDIDPLDERDEVIEKAEAVTKSQERPLFHDWGDSLWDEIQEDWGEDDLGETKFSDLSARYLNAWADVARIGTAAARKKTTKDTSNIKIPAIKSQAGSGTGESQSRRVKPVPSPAPKMLNVKQSDNVVAPPRRHPPSQYINRRRPIKRTRL